jgi:hypothetical protein
MSELIESEDVRPQLQPCTVCGTGGIHGVKISYTYFSDLKDFAIIEREGAKAASAVAMRERARFGWTKVRVMHTGELSVGDDGKIGLRFEIAEDDGQC